jgi:hypothetical protein
MIPLFLSCLVWLVQPAAADTASMVLQNGQNGYTGCSDAFIENMNQAPNGGSAGLKTSCG